MLFKISMININLLERLFWSEVYSEVCQVFVKFPGMTTTSEICFQVYPLFRAENVLWSNFCIC